MGKCGTSLDFFTRYRRLQAFCQLLPVTELLFFQRAAPCFFTSRRKAAPAAGENGHTRARAAALPTHFGPGKLFLAGLHLTARHRFEMGHQRAGAGGRAGSRHALQRGRIGAAFLHAPAVIVGPAVRLVLNRTSQT